MRKLEILNFISFQAGGKEFQKLLSPDYRNEGFYLLSSDLLSSVQSIKQAIHVILVSINDVDIL